MPERTPFEKKIEKQLTLVAAVAGNAAALIGAFYFLSWMSGAMTYLGLQTITVKTNASLCLILCGIALVLAVPVDAGAVRRRCAGGLATASLMIGGMTLLQHIGGWDFGIDQMLASEPTGALGVLHPNRMGPPGAVSFTLCGAAILLLLRKTKATARAAQSLGVILCLIAMLGMLGYLYEVKGLYGAAKYTGIAWQTTVAILLLGVGLLCARPRDGLMAVATADDPGGMAIRRLLLPAAAITVLLGWLRLEGERRVLYETAYGTSILVLSWIIIFSFLIYLTGKRLGAMAGSQRDAVEELQRTQKILLEAESLSHTGAWEWDLKKDLWTMSDEWLRIHGVGSRSISPDELLAIAHPDDRAAIKEAFDALRRGETGYLIQHRIIRQDTGEVRIVKAQGQFLKDRAGNVVRVYGIAQDVTEMVRAEEQLRESEKRLKSVIEHLAEGLVVVDPKGGALYWNRKALEMLEYERQGDELTFLDSLVDQYELLTLGGEVVPVERWPAKRVMDQEEYEEYELIVRHRKRSWQRIYNFSGGVIRGSAGEAVMGLLTMRDVTARKEAEAALRESEELLRKVTETLPVAVWIIGRDGVVTHANYAAQEIWAGAKYVGVEQFGEYKGWWLDTGKRISAEEWGGARAITKGETSLNEEVEIECFDGTRKIILNSSVPIRNEKGEITGAITIHQDITRRKRAEIALRESEKQSRAVFQYAAVGMGRVDFTQARWIDVNDAFCRMIGYRRDELLATSWPEMTHPEDVELDLIPFRQMAEGKLESYRVEKRFIHKDGHYVWARLTLSLVRDPHGDPDYEIAIIEDITDRKHAEEALRKAKDELELRVKERTQELERAYADLKRETEERIAAVDDLRKNEQLLIQQSRLAAMGEMLGNIAHQWRQPLNVLGLLIQQLPVSLELGEMTQEFLEQEVAKAMQVVLHMSQTINDFQNFLQEDKEKKSFNVNRAVVTTLSLLEATLKNLNVEVAIVEKDKLEVTGHRNEFSQVVMNIVTNARDAFRERKTKAPKIVITLFREGAKSVLTIADNAGGIPESIIAKIFDPYFTTKGPDRGTGIGLFMSRNIVEKSLNGTLTVRNTAEGAEFRVEV